MAKFLIVHTRNQEFVSNHVNHLCKVCAKEKGATWKRVNFNIKSGRIFCLWEAPDKETIVGIMEKCNMPAEEILEVEEMTPGECSWDIFGEIDD